MTTNIVVYCYTVTQDKYIWKLTKHHLLYFDSQSISLICQELSSLHSMTEYLKRNWIDAANKIIKLRID
jgi:uncharacterized protein YlbG (UPF0298 family)